MFRQAWNVLRWEDGPRARRHECSVILMFEMGRWLLPDAMHREHR